MHAHERTLLNQLGFADADKKDRRHDLACQFLAIKENARAVASLFIPRPISVNEGWPTYTLGANTTEVTGSARFALRDVQRVDSEVPLNKGTGQYKTTVGFIDSVIRCHISIDETLKMRKREFETSAWGEWEGFTREVKDRLMKVLVEVKIARVSIGEIIRQVNLYRQFCGEIKQDQLAQKIATTHWCLAAAFDLTEHENSQLATASIKYVRLGAKFDCFVEEQGRDSAEKGGPALEL